MPRAWQIVNTCVCGWGSSSARFTASAATSVAWSMNPKCHRAQLLSVLVLQGMPRVVEQAGLLEVRQGGGEFALCRIRCAHDTMRNAQRRRVLKAFGLFQEFTGCGRLLGDFTSDVVARPNPVKDCEFLYRIGQIVDQVLCSKQDFGGFPRGIAVDGNHGLAEHDLEPERCPSACRILGTRFQQFERLGQMPDRLGVGGTLDGALACLSQVVDGAFREPGLDQMMRQKLGLSLHGFGEALFESIGNAVMKLLPLAAHEGAVGRVLNQGVLEYIG
jgi:hypothetical protein